MVRRRVVLLWSLAVGLALAATTLRSVWASGRVLEQTTLVEMWTFKAPGVTTMVATRLRPGTEPVLVLQGPGFVMTVGADGAAGSRKAIPGLAVAATGDVTGDGADEVLIATGPKASVQALDARLEPLWSAGPLAGMGVPARLAPADLDKDDRREVLVGDTAGRVTALSPTGTPLWSWGFEEKKGQETDAVRGLDDQRVGAERRVIVARRSGELAVIHGGGKLLEQRRMPTGIRRLRLIDLDGDKDPEILVGMESGSSVLPAGKGEAVSLTTGEAITEIRRVETDGDPATVELAVGGKNGGVSWLAAGRVVAAGYAGGKISELAGMDLTGDGRDELLVGTESGVLSVFDPGGRRLLEQKTAGKVERIASLISPLRERLAVVAAGPAVTAYRLKTLTAPAWYSPLGAAGLGFAVLGLVVGTLLGVGSTGRSPAATGPGALEASIAKVEGLVARGVVSVDAAADRIAQLRRQARKAVPGQLPEAR